LIVEAQRVAQNSRMSSTRKCWPWAAPFALVVLVTASSCHKSESIAETKIDVCGLISRDDVESIQGSSVKEIKANDNTNGGFRTTDCSYVGETAGQSVTLSLVQKNARSEKAIDPREYWKTSFSRYSDEAKGQEAEAEKEKSEGEHEIEVHPANVKPPKKIDDLGEAAFWTTDFTGGALYVLKGDIFIRVRVNGPESEESRIDKSKALAVKALSRL
jgi:hypothetical protein